MWSQNGNFSHWERDVLGHLLFMGGACSTKNQVNVCPGLDTGRKKEVFGQKIPKLLFHLGEAAPVMEFPSSTPHVLLWLAGGLGFPSSLCKADTHQYYSKWLDSK